MRLWSIHPLYLDSKGLVALWREGLLAQKVLMKETKGYRNHPQLNRFKENKNSLGAIAEYLKYVYEEATNRGYHFDRNKILNKRVRQKMEVPSGQVVFEFEHLLKKLKTRDPDRFHEFKTITKPKLHPLFKKVQGKVADWEIIS